MSESSTSAVDPEAVRAIVAEVLRRIRGAGLQPAGIGVGHQGAGLAGADAGRLQVRPTVEGSGIEGHRARGFQSAEGSVPLSGRVISLAMLEKLPAGVTRVTVEAAAVITPSAREHARDKGIAIERAATAGGGIADVVAALAVHAARDAARGVLRTGKPALAVVLANRSASLRAVTARDPATLAAAAAECNANLLVVDPASFPTAALLRLAGGLATKPAGETPAPLAARPAGCGCKGH